MTPPMFTPSINASSTTTTSTDAGASANANAYFARQGGARDASALDLNPFTHYWSLDVEEQFYLVFPLLMLAAYRTQVVASPPRAAPASPPTPAHATTLLVLVFLAGVALSCYMSLAHLQLAYFWMPPRLWELLSGALLFDLHAHHKRRCLWLRDDRLGWACRAALQFGAAACLGTSVVYTREDALFPFPWACLPVAGTLCYIGAGEASYAPRSATAVQPGLRPRSSRRLRVDVLNALGAHRTCVYVGLISYPLYLWHWPVIVLFRHTCGLESAAQICGAACAFIVGALASYHGLEVRATRIGPCLLPLTVSPPPDRVSSS